MPLTMIITYAYYAGSVKLNIRSKKKRVLTREIFKAMKTLKK